MTKHKFVKAICPYCHWFVIGNWKEMAKTQVMTHILENHVQEPLIEEI